jgi:hypothetical protein
MGRYLMHLSPLYLILFMIGLNKMRDEFDSLHVSTIVLAALLSCGAILFSWGVLFRSPMWHLKFDFVNSPDGVSYQFTIFTALMLLAVVVMAVILAFGRKNPTTARRFVLPFSVFVIVFVQIASCFGAYHWSVLRDREIVHGKVLAEFLQDEVKKKAHKITLVCDTPSASASAALVLSYSLKFWLSLPEKDRSVDVIPAKDYHGDRNIYSGKTLLLTTEECSTPMLSYVIAKKEIPFSGIIRGWVLDRYPQWENMAHDHRYNLCAARSSSPGPRTKRVSYFQGGVSR